MNINLPVILTDQNDRSVQDNEAIGHMPEALRDAVRSALEYQRNDKAGATRRAYASDFRDFAAWCESVEQPSMPAHFGTVAAYLATLVDRKLKAATIRRRLAAIRHAHVSQGFDAPTDSAALGAVHRGIRRKIGTRQDQKAPITAKVLGALLKKTPDNLTGSRDRAILLIAFGAALRRSEVVGLDIDDVELTHQGAFVHIRQSKTDQEGAGHMVPVPSGSKFKPIEALKNWLRDSRRSAGSLFVRIRKGGVLTDERLTDRSVADIVKKYALAAKLDPDLFSGHSLRAGILTDAYESTKDLAAVADLARHKKLETTRGYIRRNEAMNNVATRKVL